MSHVAEFHNTKSALGRLQEMRDFGGAAQSPGLRDEVIQSFLSEREDLGLAIERGYARFLELQESRPDYVALDEQEQVRQAHAGLTNFYAEDAVNPYVAVGGAGPWIVTLKGAVIYDCGGYGMLGLGHAPPAVLEAMNQPHVMANIMTASPNKLDFVEHLRAEIGHTRPDGFPYKSFLCLNSGSEAMSVAARITDINTKNLTDPGCRHEGRKVHGLTLTGSFHGRTDRPARSRVIQCERLSVNGRTQQY